MSERKENSSNQVLRHVVEKVISGEILPREILYETTVSADTGLSRTPVREALARLVNDGFLEQTKGKRGYAVPPLTLEDMRNVYHARECIEQKISFLAAEKAVKSDVEFLERINSGEIDVLSPSHSLPQSSYSRADEIYSSGDVNVMFHLSVARIARNKYLERVYETAYWRSHLYTYYIIKRRPFPPAVEEVFQRRNRENRGTLEHLELINAISIRDGELAATLTRNHMQNTTYYTIAFNHPEVLSGRLP